MRRGIIPWLSDRLNHLVALYYRGRPFMTARPIAPALTSVFAIDHEGQIRIIERGTDGLWGRWQPTGIAASRVVHAGTVVASLGPDRRISALPRTAGGSWVTWERQARE